MGCQRVSPEEKAREERKQEKNKSERQLSKLNPLTLCAKLVPGDDLSSQTQDTNNKY